MMFFPTQLSLRQSSMSKQNDKKVNNNKKKKRNPVRAHENNESLRHDNRREKHVEKNRIIKEFDFFCFQQKAL